MLLSGCPDEEPLCGPGFVLEGDSCVRVDAGPVDSGSDAPGDAGADADTAVDAGPCGMECTAPTPYCNETTGDCVACLMDSDCTELDAPQCDTTAGTCGPCDADAACMGRTGTEVCALSGDSTGSCVECVDNSTCGAMEGCDLPMNSCRSYTAASVGACGDCVADEECMMGMLCIPWTYDDPTTTAADPVDVGNHCAWRQDASGMGAPGGDCTTLPPYVSADMTTSVDGMESTFCTLARSTCEAQTDFSATSTA